MNTEPKKIPFYRYFLLLAYLAGFSLCLTILYLSMRAVMAIGGYCAEGGPYEIQVHCPRGTVYLAPLSIFGMLIFGFFYFMSLVPNAFNFGYLFWTALFGALGWNFLDFTIQSYYQKNLQIGWLICAIIFLLMAAGPCFLFSNPDLKNILFDYQTTTRINNAKIILFSLQIMAIVTGIILGLYLYQKAS